MKRYTIQKADRRKPAEFVATNEEFRSLAAVRERFEELEVVEGNIGRAGLWMMTVKAIYRVWDNYEGKVHL